MLLISFGLEIFDLSIFGLLLCGGFFCSFAGFGFSALGLGGCFCSFARLWSRDRFETFHPFGSDTFLPSGPLYEGTWYCVADLKLVTPGFELLISFGLEIFDLSIFGLLFCGGFFCSFAGFDWAVFGFSAFGLGGCFCSFARASRVSDASRVSMEISSSLSRRNARLTISLLPGSDLDTIPCELCKPATVLVATSKRGIVKTET